MKLFSWNVNGIRAAQKNGFLNWFEKENADIVCVQEIKATPEVLDQALLHPLNTHSYWHPAKKPGYSGVAVFSKTEPLRIQQGFGIADIDDEGRVLILEYPRFTLLNAYFPNSQREHTRLPYKLAFCRVMLAELERLRQSGKPVILCGDFNIAHKEIDLKNPKANMDNAGFLPEERAWMDELIGTGYVDAFRRFHKEPDQYTWWSYMPGVRQKNIGWRLDYFVINGEATDLLKNAEHQPKVLGSDHCPVLLELRD